MLNSMTGYGSAQRTEGDFVIEVEARSVNNRFLKVNFRAPEPFSKSQKPFEDIVKQTVARGTIDLGIRLFRGKTSGAPTIQETVLESYYQQLAALKEKLNIAGKIDLSLLLSLPGTVETYVVVEDEALAERLTQIAAEATREAMERLAQMRRDEGAALEKDFKGILDDLETHAQQVEARRPELLKDYRSRLLSRVQELLEGTDVEVSEGDLARELALFAERSDIAEELQRLRSHAAQFREACDREEAVGRRLEFIAQEMHREVNTMGAKASDSALGGIVIEMKGLVDRMKEQVMNVE